MMDILNKIRHSQWRWDYAAAGHGNGFHSPLETLRVIATGITLAGEARIELSRLLASKGYMKEVPYPDISSKEKAQALIGLEMKSLEAEKARFLSETLPQWKSIAVEREKGYEVKAY